MIEVEDLLAKMEVLQHTRAAPSTSPQRVLIVGDHDALLGPSAGARPPPLPW